MNSTKCEAERLFASEISATCPMGMRVCHSTFYLAAENFYSMTTAGGATTAKLIETPGQLCDNCIRVALSVIEHQSAKFTLAQVKLLSYEKIRRKL